MSRVKSLGSFGLITLATLAAFYSQAPAWGQDAARSKAWALAADDGFGSVPGPNRTGRPSQITPRPDKVTPSEAMPPNAIAGESSQATTDNPPQSATNPLDSLFAQNGGAEPGARLAGTPNMFGDSLDMSSRGNLMVSTSSGEAIASLPLAGASRRVKIAENNNTFPQDRIHFMYNHFQNALDADVSGLTPPSNSRSFAVDRYTIGFEKTLFDHLWSVEVRMPFAGEVDFETTNFGFSGGHVGNLAVIVKRLVYQGPKGAACVGLGIDTPTGSSVSGFADNTHFTLENNAVHLLPYAGLLLASDSRWFFQGFLQVDVPTNGNRVDFSDPILGSGTWGLLNDQTLLYTDLELGYWLLRNPCREYLTGLAFLTELHYTTTLENADSVSGAGSSAAFQFGNLANRVDILNLTVGLNAELGPCTTCRVAGVFPLRSGDDRLFDSEIQVQLQRRF